MLDHEIFELCRKLRPLIGTQADRLWYLYSTSESMHSRQENEGFIRAIALRELGATVHRPQILLPPPDKRTASGELYLGNILYAGRPQFPLMQRISELPKHTALIGATGSGKTTAMHGMLIECLRLNIPFAVIDWKRSYRNLLNLNSPASRDIKVYTIGRCVSPLDWNALQAPPGTSIKTWIKIIGEVLTRSHVSGDGVSLIIMEALESMLGNVAPDPDYHMNFEDLRVKLEHSKQSGRKGLWLQSAQRVVHALTYDSEATFSVNARKPINLVKLLEKPIIIELDMSLPADFRIFFSEILLRWIHLYRLHQGETKETRHLLVLEEAHNMLVNNSFKNDPHNHLQTILRELRGFGNGVVILTQTLSNLPQWLVANINTLVIFMLSHESDILSAKKALFLRQNEEVYLDLLKVGEAIVKIKGRTPSCHVKIPDMPEIIKERVPDERLKQ